MRRAVFGWLNSILNLLRMGGGTATAPPPPATPSIDDLLAYDTEITDLLAYDTALTDLSAEFDNG